jgi:prepilin signal peptidase PulO-like enzyme (type II secretory pathway)
MLLDILTFVLGLVLGFLAGVLINAFADALPRLRRPALPTYSDGSARPLPEWSGIIAYFSGGRKKYDGTPPEPVMVEQPDGTMVEMYKVPPHRITIRHPLVEIGTALFFAFVAVNWSGDPRLPIWFLYLTILILISVIDIEHYIIITPVIAVSCALAMAIAVLFPEDDVETREYFIGGGVGLAIFLLMYWGGLLFASLVGAARGQKLDEVAFGFGDVMLATLCGLMIGWAALIFALLITVFIGALGALLYMVGRQFTSDKYALFTPLPYGPYIVIGTIIMMLWREDVRRLLGSD